MKRKKANMNVWIDLLLEMTLKESCLFFYAPLSGRDPRKVLFALAGSGLLINQGGSNGY